MTRPRPNRKLQPYQVIRLRQMMREGFPRKFLTELFGISKTSYRFIQLYSNYKELR
jgi:hypothetical protein